MYAVRSKDGFGVFDGHGWVVDPAYKWIGSFHSGVAFAQTQNGSDFLIDANGNQTALHDIVASFSPAESVEFIAPNDAVNSPGSLVVASATGWTAISLDRQLQPQRIGSFPRDCDVAVYYGGNWLITRVSQASTHQFVLAQPGSERVVELKGLAYIDPPSYDSSLLAVMSDEYWGHWAYYCPLRERIVSNWFFFARSFSGGLGLTQKEAAAPFEFLDLELSKVDGLEFEWADVFRFGLAAAVKDGVSGYYDQQGGCQIQCDGERGRFNRLGHAIIDRDIGNRSVEIIDRSGNALIGKLESCTFVDGDFPCYHASKQGKHYILTENLKVIPGETSL